jgi:glycosyltransferase involved in cell wall biosynthesis
MNKKLKILMICHKSQQGAFARSHAMGHQLVSRGHQVTLLLISEKKHWHIHEFNWDGVRAVETPQLSIGRLRYGWDLWNTFWRFGFLSRDPQVYDLVHCFETRPATIYPALWYSRKHHLPIITDWNDWWGHKGLIAINRPWWYSVFKLKVIETYFEESFRTKAAGLTAISSALADRAMSLGVNPERILHIPGGTFPDWFKLRSKEECRKRIGLPLDIPILGFSSYDSHLDTDIVMAALSIVARTFPTIKLIVTGKARKTIYKLTKDHQVQDQVNFVGFVPFEELPWYLGCANLFLLPMLDLPYNRGRWPNKLGDYMSLGRPTIANPVGDVKTLFEEHSIGVLADWEPEDFAKKIIALLRNPELAGSMGMNARRVAETEFDWRILVEKLERFYCKICELEK